MNSFDINSYSGSEYVMHCKDEKEAELFCEYLHYHGRKWGSGLSYNEDSFSDRYKGMMCYYFNTGMYADLPYCIKEGCKILEFSDFCWDGLINTHKEDYENFDSFINEFIVN